MFIKILDYFFLLRPTLFFTGITIYLLSVFPEEPPLQYILSVLVFQGVIYLYNQFYDIETDRVNNKLFFLAENLIPLRKAIRFYYFLLILLSVLLATTNLQFTLVITLAVVVLSYGYSHPVFNWKGKPFASAFCALAGGILGCLSGHFTSRQDFDLHVIYSALPAGLAVLTAAVLGMILDYKGDLQSGKQTLAVYLGLKRIRYVLYAITFCGLLSSGLQSEVFFLISFFSSFLLQIICPEKTDWQLKAPILTLALSACWHYPVYLLYIGGYYIVARCYFRYRFNLKYP